VEDLKYRKLVNATPYPSFPFQWLTNELVSFSAVRTEALMEVGTFRKFSWPEYEHWDLFNAVMAAGWSAVTLPAILGKKQNKLEWCSNPYNSKPHGRICKEMMERFPDLIAQDLQELLLLAISSGKYLMNSEPPAMQNKPELTERNIQNPGALKWKFFNKLNNKMKQKFPLRVYNFIDKIKNQR
jgi:hypothetical protein